MDLKVKGDQRKLDFEENLRKAKGKLNENKEFKGKN